MDHGRRLKPEQHQNQVEGAALGAVVQLQFVQVRRRLERGQQEGVDGVGEYPADEEGGREAQHHDDQARPQLDQMLHQRRARRLDLGLVDIGLGDQLALGAVFDGLRKKVAHDDAFSRPTDLRRAGLATGGASTATDSAETFGERGLRGLAAGVATGSGAGSSPRGGKPSICGSATGAAAGSGTEVITGVREFGKVRWPRISLSSARTSL